jgi:hypothetical protein
VGHRDFLQNDKPVFAKDDVKALQLKEVFYLAVLLYNIWVFINYKREKVTVQYVKFLLMIEALISNIYVKIFK